MKETDNPQKKPMPVFSRPWIEGFPERALADRDQRPEIADADLRAFLPDGCVVAYVDEFKRTHVLEARAYGLAQDKRALLIGFQIAHGLVHGTEWKAVERIDRIFVIERNVQFSERMIPSQHANQLTKIFALAPVTGLDMSKHEADGY